MATLQITKKLYVTPLIDVQSTTFAECYVTGVRLGLFGWREHGEVEVQGLLPEYYLIDNPKRCAQINRFWAIGCIVGELSGRLFPLAKLQLSTHTALFAKQRTILQEA